MKPTNRWDKWNAAPVSLKLAENEWFEVAFRNAIGTVFFKPFQTLNILNVHWEFAEIWQITNPWAALPNGTIPDP